MIWVLAGIIWIICFLYSYSVAFAYWDRRFPILAKSDYKSNMMMSICFSLFGPMSVILVTIKAILIPRKFYGFKFK